MNLVKLSWQNIRFRPWSTALNVILFATGVLLITIVMLFKQQMEQQFDRNLAGIDMVVGAKGSPLQLILSSIYHIDYPTGNISKAEADSVAAKIMVEKAIPMSLGDGFKGFRVVGTNSDYIDLYQGELSEGKLFEHDREVVLGSFAASQLQLKVGDTFEGQHENHAHAEHRADHAFKVVGILKPSESVLDQLIITDLATIWAIHPHEAEEEDTVQTFDPLMSAYGSKPAAPDKQITALLVLFKSPMAALTYPRDINENTNMQAASPVIESARLFSITGAGAKGLEWLAILIMAISGISVLLSLYSSMRDRRYEMAILRVSGASRFKIFSMVILEGLFTAWIGVVFGVLLGHVAMSFLAGYLQETYRYSFSGWHFADGEWILFLVATIIGIVAALIPAVSAMKTDISYTLKK